MNPTQHRREILAGISAATASLVYPRPLSASTSRNQSPPLGLDIAVTYPIARNAYERNTLNSVITAYTRPLGNGVPPVGDDIIDLHLSKGPFFAAMFYKALCDALPNASISFEPGPYAYPQMDAVRPSGLDPTIAPLVAQVSVTKDWADIESLMTFWKSEPLTCGNQVSPVLQVSSNASSLTAGSQPIVAFRRNVGHLVRERSTLSPGAGLSARRIYALEVPRLQLASGEWQAYLADPARRNPFLAAWATQAAHSLATYYRSLDQAALRQWKLDKYSRVLFPGSQFRMNPAAQTVLAAAMNAEGDFIRQQSKDAYSRAGEGDYARAVQRAMASETQALDQFRRAKREEMMGLIAMGVSMAASGYQSQRTTGFATPDPLVAFQARKLGQATIGTSLRTTQSITTNLAVMDTSAAGALNGSRAVAATAETTITAKSVDDLRGKLRPLVATYIIKSRG